jgi:glycosyltransferase involved in cell wall biosynthesis
MLIGIDASRAALRERTGTENYSYQLIQHLLALDTPQRFRLYVQAPPPAGLFNPRAEQRVISHARLWTHRGLSLEMLRHPPDVLFVPAHVLPLWHPPRSVVTIHDLGHRFFPDAHTPSQRRYLELSTQFAARQAKMIIVVSKNTGRDLVKLYGADPKRVVVVHHGVAQLPIRDNAVWERVRVRFDLPKQYIVAIGTVQPRKNYARLIEAYTRLQLPMGRRVGLVIVGKAGWHDADIKARAQKAGVILTGHIGDEEKFELLAGATCFALPSLYEGFGMAILEAQAAGVPVLTSNTSSCPEVAGEGALLVDPLNLEDITFNLQRLLDDRVLRLSLIERGLANVQRFSWDECARRTLHVLELAGKS